MHSLVSNKIMWPFTNHYQKRERYRLKLKMFINEKCFVSLGVVYQPGEKLKNIVPGVHKPDLPTNRNFLNID